MNIIFYQHSLLYAFIHMCTVNHILDTALVFLFDIKTLKTLKTTNKIHSLFKPLNKTRERIIESSFGTDLDQLRNPISSRSDEVIKSAYTCFLMNTCIFNECNVPYVCFLVYGEQFNGLIYRHLHKVFCPVQ